MMVCPSCPQMQMVPAAISTLSQVFVARPVHKWKINLKMYKKSNKKALVKLWEEKMWNAESPHGSGVRQGHTLSPGPAPRCSLMPQTADHPCQSRVPIHAGLHPAEYHATRPPGGRGKLRHMAGSCSWAVWAVPGRVRQHRGAAGNEDAPPAHASCHPPGLP